MNESANESERSQNINNEENERAVTPDLSVPADIMPPPSVQIIKGTFFAFKTNHKTFCNSDGIQGKVKELSRLRNILLLTHKCNYLRFQIKIYL